MKKLSRLGIATAAMTAALAATVAAPSTALAGYLGYQDVDEGHWGAQSGVIEYASGRGLLAGYTGDGQGDWGPDDQVTRGQMALIMYRVCMSEDATSPTEIQGKGPFDNVYGAVCGKYYEVAMDWAYQEGLIRGNGFVSVGEGCGISRGDWFENEEDCLVNCEPYVRPDDGVTREELAVMLTRLAEHRGDYDVTTVDLAALDAAPDGASVGEWAREGVAWTVGNGLMGGAPGGRLSPQEVTSRAEAAKMLMVYLKGEGLELSEHDRVWVDGRVHTNLPSWKCTSCGATSAEGKDAIAHWDTCPSNAGETVWISESWTGKQWIDLAEAPEDQCAWARRIIEKYGMLEGWYDWVWV